MTDDEEPIEVLEDQPLSFWDMTQSDLDRLTRFVSEKGIRAFMKLISVEVAHDTMREVEQAVLLISSEMSSEEPPKRTDKPDEELSLTGLLLPYRDDQPVILSITGSDLHYVPVFTTREMLEGILDSNFESIKVVQDGTEFLSSFDSHPSVRVIIDPWMTLEGKVRYTQVTRAE